MDMTPFDQYLDLMTQLHGAERHLLSRHSIRLRVDRVTVDGRNAICSAAQVQYRFFRPDHRSDEIASICHESLSSLYRVGLNPLIGTLQRSTNKAFGRMDPKDPFQLRRALLTAGREELLLPGYLLPVTEYRKGRTG
jgi:hypothetical protein